MKKFTMLWVCFLWLTPTTGATGDALHLIKEDGDTKKSVFPNQSISTLLKRLRISRNGDTWEVSVYDDQYKGPDPEFESQFSIFSDALYKHSVPYQVQRTIVVSCSKIQLTFSDTVSKIFFATLFEYFLPCKITFCRSFKNFYVPNQPLKDLKNLTIHAWDFGSFEILYVLDCPQLKTFFITDCRLDTLKLDKTNWKALETLTVETLSMTHSSQIAVSRGLNRWNTNVNFIMASDWDQRDHCIFVYHELAKVPCSVDMQGRPKLLARKKKSIESRQESGLIPLPGRPLQALREKMKLPYED